MARTLDREPTYQTVKVAPSYSPPAGAVRPDPFIRPTDQPSTESTLSTMHFLRTDSSATKHQSIGKLRSDLPQTDHPATSTSGTDPPVSQKHLSSQASSRPFRKDSISSLE